MKYFLLFVITLLCSCSFVDRKPSEEENSLLRFHTDSNYLILHVLVNTKSDRISNNDYQKDLINFQNKIWNEKKGEYERLLQEGQNNGLLSYLKFKKIEAYYIDLINFAKCTDEFKVIETQTNIYKNEIEALWLNNLSKTKIIMEEITGLSFEKTHEVMITHPALKNGKELGGQWIEWGGYSESNYVLRFLWHEVLHNYFDKSNLSHALIELTDHELYYQLTNTIYPPLNGHTQLRSIEFCLLEYWKSYLSASPKNILNFKQLQKTLSCGQLFKDLDW